MSGLGCGPSQDAICETRQGQSDFGSAGPFAVRLSEIPSRLSGWFTHAFSSSSTDLPAILSQQHLATIAAGSPKGKSSALLTVAKHGKGHLDKAMRYLLDSDATPDKCSDPIWLLGVEHPGYEPNSQGSLGRRSSVESRRSPSSRSVPSTFSASPPWLSKPICQRFWTFDALRRATPSSP